LTAQFGGAEQGRRVVTVGEKESYAESRVSTGRRRAGRGYQRCVWWTEWGWGQGVSEQLKPETKNDTRLRRRGRKFKKKN